MVLYVNEILVTKYAVRCRCLPSGKNGAYYILKSSIFFASADLCITGCDIDLK